MTYFLNILVLTTLSLFSVSSVPYFSVLHVIPMLSLFFIVGLSYFRDGFEPIILAALVGLFFDLTSVNPFGFYLVLFLSAAALVRYLFQKKMNSLSFWRYYLICGIFVTVGYMAQIVILYFSDVTINFMSFRPLIYSILLNTIFIFAMYFFVEWYFDKMIRIEDKLKRR
jgi:rod shape-determining protein MreD